MKKTLKDMRILLLLAVAIGGALAAMYFYQMKILTHLTENAAVVTDSGVFRTLKNGTGEEGQKLELTEVSDQDPVYLRLGSMYVGADKIEADASLPFYVNNGGSVLFLLNNASLYNEEFETLDSFTGMYLADGITYNYDKTQADDDSFLFARLSNGLILNARPMTVKIPGQTYVLPANSILYMDETTLNFYRNEGEDLSFGKVMSTSMAEVTIADKTYSYDELLQKLDLINGKGSSDLNPQGNEQDAETLVPEEGDITGADKAQSDNDTKEDDSDEEQVKEEYPLKPGKDQAASNQAADQDSSSDSASGKTDSDSAGSSSSNGNSGTNNSGSAAGAAGSSGSGSSTGSGTESGDGTGDKTDNGPSVPGEAVKIPFVVPTGELTGLTTDIYSLSGTLSLKDPSMALKRVTLELYWVPANEDGSSAGNVSDKDKYQLMYRRTYKAAGNFTIDNLPPNTTIYVKGNLTYYTEGLETKTITFYDSFENRVTTKSMDTMDPVYVDFKPSEPGEHYLQNQIQIYDLRISGPNQNVVKKINKAIVHIKTYDRNDSSSKVTGESKALSMSSLVLDRNYLYKEEGADYLSDMKQFSIPANSRVEYTIEFYDLFGNRLTNMENGYQENQVQEGQNSLSVVGGKGSYPASGTSYTCRMLPTVTAITVTNENKVEGIDKLRFQISVNDRHKALKEGTEIILKLYQGEATEKNLKETKIIPADNFSSTQDVTFTNLTAGEQYQLLVYGDYDLQDNYGLQEKALLGTVNASTISLSAYGRVNYSMTASHVKTQTETEETGTVYESATAQQVNTQINFRTTEPGLFTNGFVDTIQMAFTKTGTNEKVFTGDLKKERLEELKVVGKGQAGSVQTSFTLDQIFGDDYKWADKKKPEPTVSLTYQDFAENTESNFWKLFTEAGTNAVLTLDFGEGSLESFTGYQLYLTTYAKQGNKTHDISGRTNSTRRVQFTTLRQMPKFAYSDIMVYSSEVDIYDVEFNDPDQSIYNGKITVSDGTVSTSYTIDYSEKGGKLKEPLQIRDLRVGSTYTITVTADQIRRSGTTSYRYNHLTLFSWTFTAGDGISGHLNLDRLAFSLTGRGDNKKKSYLLEDFDVFNGKENKGQIINANGTLSDNGSWRTTDFLEIEGGKVYYFDHVRENDAYESYVAFYDENKEPLRCFYNNSCRGRIFNGSYIQAPKNAKYIRYSAVNDYKGEYNFYVGGCYAMEKEEGAEIVEKALKDGVEYKQNTILTISSDGTKDIRANAGKDALILTVRQDSSNQATYTFYSDEAGKNKIKEVTVYPGCAADIPAGAKAVTLGGAGANADRSPALYVVDKEQKDWLNSADRSKMNSVVSAEVKDSRRNLVKNATYTIHMYKDGQEIKGGDLPFDSQKLTIGYADENAAGSGSTQFTFESTPGSSYKFVLTVTYRGRELTLDTLTFKADRPKYVIASVDDLYKLVRYKEADFVVTADLDIPDNTYIVRSDTYPFNGTIDFQNHQVSVRDTASDTRLFRTLGSAAVLENLEFNPTIDTTVERRRLTSVSPLAYDNYGTVRNIIVNLDLGSGYYQKNSCSGLFRYNWGTIENFALYYSGGSNNYVGNYFGGLTVYNYGTIQNGMAYSSRWLQSITGDYMGNTETASTSYVGGIAASNQSGGTLKNIYSLMTVGVERDSRVGSNPSFGGTMTTNGVLVGYMDGGVATNCFTMGDLQELYWENSDSAGWGRYYNLYTNYTPVGYGVDSKYLKNRFQNSFYFTTAASPYKMQSAGALEEGGSLARMMDKTFYNSTVNADNAFVMSDVDMGFYPRVQMNETLLNRQEKILYQKVTESGEVSYVGATVTNQQDDYADVTLMFNNVRGWTIKNLQIDGLFVTDQSKEEATLDTIAQSSYEQEAQGSFWYVKVRVWPNERYRDDYKLLSLNTALGSVSGTVTGINRSIAVSFYKKVTQENWLEAFADKSGNYRLAENIDLSAFTGDNYRTASQVLYKGVSGSNPFYGKLDGDGHTISNLKLSTKNSSSESGTQVFIPNLSGAVVKNLNFKNVKIENVTGSTQSYAAILGVATNQTEISGVYVEDIEITNPYCYAGGLIGELNNSAMKDCVVRNLKVSAQDKTSSLRLGGVVGYNNYSTIENCYTAGLNLEVSNTQANVVGIGGICGEMSYGSSLSKTYAQGRIYTTSGETGGITGLTNGRLNRSWSKVDISGSAVAGGMAGRVNSSTRASQLLAVGNVSGQAGYVGRIAGAVTSDGTTFTNAYAYDAQQLNSKISQDKLDANGLITGEELKLEANYWYYLNLGYSFDYTGVPLGYLPKLKNFAEDKLLPGQENLDIAYTVPSTVRFAVEEGAKADYDETKKAYTLDFTLDLKTPGLSRKAQEAGSEAFYKTLKTALSGITVSGMELNLIPEGADENPALCWSENATRFSWDADGVTLKLHMGDNVTIVTYRDTYQATYSYTDGAGTLWELGDDLNFGSPLYIHILSVVNTGTDGTADLVGSEEDLSTWYGAMKQEGKNYQNFLIEKDLDFSVLGTITDPDLINLNINRLEGAGFAEKEKGILNKLNKESVRKDYLLYQETEEKKTSVPMKTLSNMNVKATSTSQSVIRALQGTMQGIRISGWNWDNGSFTGSYVGIIGRNTGNIRFVDFENNTIYGGKASDRVGCIAENRGSMEYVRAKDSKVSNAAATVTHRVGGLIGYNLNGITHCSAVGSRTEDGAYTFTVNVTTGANNSTYTGGLVGQSDNYVTLCYVDKVSVTGCLDTGALAGYAAQRFGQYDEYMTDTSWQDTDLFYYCWVTDSSVTGKYRTGGVYGRASASRRNYSKGNTVTQTDTASYMAGGVMGQADGWGTRYNYAEGCTVTTKGKAAGGISGYNEHFYYETVVDCTIEAAQQAGGIVGALSQYYVRASKVEGSTITATDRYAGGIVGYTATNSVTGTNAYFDCLVTTTNVSGGSYVGGLAGIYYGKDSYNNIVDDSVTVSATNDYAGGMFGLVAGGSHYRMESGATVSARQNAGGFAGEVLGYCQKTTSSAGVTSESVIELAYPQTKVYGSVFTGKISGSYNVGGFAGLYDRGSRPIDPENGKELDDKASGYIPYLNQSMYYRILLAPVSLNCNNVNTLKLTYNNAPGMTETGSDEGIGYLRVYDGISSDSSATITNQLTQIQNTVEANSKKTLTDAEAKQSAKVSDTILASDWFYNNGVTKNGLDLNSNTSTNRYFDTRVCKEGDQTTMFPWMQANDTAYILFTDGKEPAEYVKSGAYIQQRYGYTKDNAAAIQNGSAGQDGILLPAAAKGSRASGISLLYSDADIAVEPDTLKLYASGIDRLNIDVPEDIMGYGLTWQVENTEGDVTASGSIDELLASRSGGGGATISLRYDFNSYLTLTLKMEGETCETYAVDPATLARTLSSSGSDQYYIRSGGVVSVSALAEALKAEESENGAEQAGAYADQAFAAEGSFVHLYGTKALKEDGQIVDLTTGEVTGGVEKAAVGTACLNSQAAYTTYTDSGTILDLYSEYSLATTDGLTAARRFRLFAKEGQTFAVDVDTAYADGAGIHDIIADVYANGQNQYQYLSYLTADGSVKDLGDRLHWPTELKNSGLGELAGNICGTEPILLVRYQDNTVAAFQYLTGTLVAKDSGEQKKLNFVNYATIWLMDLKSQFRKADNTAYLAAVDLAGNLAQEPIDTDTALNVIGKAGGGEGVVEEDIRSADRVTVGTNLVDGTLNAAGADWKEEVLQAKGPKGQGFLEEAGALLEDALTELATGEKRAEGGEQTKAAVITPENAEGLKDTAETLLTDTVNAGKLKQKLMAEGVSEKEAAELLALYGKSVQTAIDSAAAYSVAEGAEAGGSTEADGTGKGSGDKKELPTDGYVIAMNSETGEYEVYSEQDLLDGKKPQASLISENQKLTALKSAGLLKNTGIDLEALKVTAEENSQGILLLACAGGAVLILLLVMYRKRKKMG